MLLELRCIIFFTLLGIIFFQTVMGYALMTPKLYSPSLSANSREWSNVMPYPFRAYQPSIPPHYYARYYGNPYFGPNLSQNPEYFFTQDPYSPPFDDSDYYSNFMYYIPPARRIPYYEHTIDDDLDDIQDYDEEGMENDDEFNSQRSWWLAKNVPTNEDTDLEKFNLISGIFGGKMQKSSEQQKSKQNKIRKQYPKSRYTGIDGFGRKKDKEQVYGNFRKNPRRDEEQVWGYLVPARSNYEDEDVKELRSLLNNPTKEQTKIHYGNSDLTDWASGNMKRSTGLVEGSQTKANSSIKEKFISALKPTKMVGPYLAYDDNHRFSEEAMENSEWDDYKREEPSDFDTIKKLLALEDKVNQKIKVNKRIKACPKAKCRIQTSKPTQTYDQHESTTMRQISDSKNLETRTTPKATTKMAKNHKRSTTNDKKFNSKSFITDQDSLDRELSLLRHQMS